MGAGHECTGAMVRPDHLWGEVEAEAAEAEEEAEVEVEAEEELDEEVEVMVEGEVGVTVGVEGVAEAVGFEPTVSLHPRRFSRPLP